MDRICLDNKSNFFECRVSEYSRQVVNKNIDENEFGYDDDF